MLPPPAHEDDVRRRGVGRARRRIPVHERGLLVPENDGARRARRRPGGARRLPGRPALLPAPAVGAAAGRRARPNCSSPESFLRRAPRADSGRRKCSRRSARRRNTFASEGAGDVARVGVRRARSSCSGKTRTDQKIGDFSYAAAADAAADSRKSGGRGAVKGLRPRSGARSAPLTAPAFRPLSPGSSRIPAGRRGCSLP